MTDANENQFSLDRGEGNSPSAVAPDAARPARKTTRRKVAVRSRSKVEPSLALDGAVTEIEAPPAKPVAPAMEIAEPAGLIEMPVAEVEKPKAKRPRPSRARTPKASAEPAAQPEILATEALEKSDDPQAHVATQVISEKVMQALEERTHEIFGDHHAAPPPRPAAPGPAAAPDAPLREVTAHAPAASHPVAAGDSTMAPAVPAPVPLAVPYEGRRDDYRRPDAPEGRGRDRDRDRNRDRDHQHPSQQPQKQPFQQGARHGQGQHGQHGQQGRHQGQHYNQPPQRQFNHQGGGQPPPPPSARPSMELDGNGDSVVSRPAEMQFGEGIIEISGKGFGFLREAKRNFVQTPADIFVTPEVCRKYNLRDGQWIKGEIRRSSRGPQLFRLTALNGEDPEKFRNLPNFDELTSINPKKRIKLETVAERYTTRIMDLMTPIGKGQRGLIVAPPRTGKTTLLQHIAEAVVVNHPEMKLIILLVDERPEEVTEIRRAVPQADIMASSNDSDLKSHTRIAMLAMDRSKRLVEAGQHVFILLDSITRMARAFNNTMSGGRASQSGGLAVGALEIPRKIFAAARNTEEAGSLTIMATALIETNSKMDDAIFQEFKGTGNMELVLDRKISDQRIYPAVDIFLSGTRREELLLQAWELDKINVIRRGLAGHKPIEAIERLLGFMKKFPTNAQMLASLPG